MRPTVSTIDASPRWEVPLLSTSKPPLRVEEGLIEVGWDDPVEGADGYRVDEGAASPPPADADEAIHDHYAALQAWNEWARNQGRAAGAASPESPDSAATATACTASEEPIELGSGLDGSPPAVWAEAQQGFAPYGQLFSRLR